MGRKKNPSIEKFKSGADEWGYDSGLWKCGSVVWEKSKKNLNGGREIRVFGQAVRVPPWRG